MLHFVSVAYSTGEFHQHLNHSLIFLIPEVENLENITHMRPIALCNVIVKVVT